MEKITRESIFEPAPSLAGDGAHPNPKIIGESDVSYTGRGDGTLKTPQAGDGAFESAIEPSKYLDDSHHLKGSGRKASMELKERYKLEAEFLRQKLGSLESLRRELGLSQRKMSELLLVDPASWHRWARQDRAPSYIYKSLQWFLALRERNPEIASLAWMKTHSTERENLYLEERIEQLSKEIELLKRSADKSTSSSPRKESATQVGFIALGVAIGFALCYWLLRVF